VFREDLGQVGPALKGFAMNCATRLVYRIWGLALVLILLGSSIAAAEGQAGPAAAPGAATVAAPAAGAPAAGTTAGGTGTSIIGLDQAQQLMTRIYEILAEYGLRVLGALLILLIGRWVAKLLSGLLARLLTKAKMDPTLIPFVENLAYMAMLMFVIVAALDRVGVQTASFIAVLGAAGLAVGLALQGSLANFASGVLLLVFKPFRIGDFVEIGGVKGTVQAIHVFNTVLNSPDNVRIIVPNSQATGTSILNYSINGTRRIDLVVSVSYDDDLRQARRVIENVLAGESRLLAEPAPQIAVSEMGSSSIDFVVRPWVKVADYWDVRFALVEKLKVTLEENGLSIPFPQHDVHIRTPAAASAALKSA
jgi:small conductance mechanosensitive channel